MEKFWFWFLKVGIFAGNSPCYLSPCINLGTPEMRISAFPDACVAPLPQHLLIVRCWKFNTVKKKVKATTKTFIFWFPPPQHVHPVLDSGGREHIVASRLGKSKITVSARCSLFSCSLRYPCAMWVSIRVWGAVWSHLTLLNHSGVPKSDETWGVQSSEAGWLKFDVMGWCVLAEGFKRITMFVLRMYLSAVILAGPLVGSNRMNPDDRLSDRKCSSNLSKCVTVYEKISKLCKGFLKTDRSNLAQKF